MMLMLCYLIENKLAEKNSTTGKGWNWNRKIEFGLYVT